jgi:hypothetical protein
MTKNIYLNIEILAAVRVQLEDGTYGTHILIDDKDLLALQSSALADFIEGEIDDKAIPVEVDNGKGKELQQPLKTAPSKWLTKEGAPRHSYLGLDVQQQSTAKIAAPVVGEKPPK